MGCNSPTSGPERRAACGAGFTLLEVMMATVITGIVFSGVLSAYIFLGRALTRQGNEEQLESQGRVALYWFTQDVSTATTVDPHNMTATSLGLYLPDSTDEVFYTYSAANGTLTRTTSGAAPGPASLVLMTKLSSLAFNYYNFVPDTTPTAPPVPPAAGVKQVNMAFALVSGLAVSGAQATLVVTSPRVTLKNKVLLGASPGLP
jgi:prepilin-type N-terminal cleavage/methylation domain-containing protein